jgi:GNAT superfamily N-acetyltransferase
VLPASLLTHLYLLLFIFTLAQAYREWDFSNMLTVLLRFNGRAVAAAVVRVFGSQLAELPLVATRPDARRQGHARVLVRAIEATLNELGVQVGFGRCCYNAAAVLRYVMCVGRSAG